MHLSKKYTLILYQKALKSHYKRALQGYVFQGNSQKVAWQVAIFLAQFNLLFEDEKANIKPILANQVTAFLKSSPQSIEPFQRLQEKTHGCSISFQPFTTAT